MRSASFIASYAGLTWGLSWGRMYRLWGRDGDQDNVQVPPAPPVPLSFLFFERYALCYESSWIYLERYLRFGIAVCFSLLRSFAPFGVGKLVFFRSLGRLLGYSGLFGNLGLIYCTICTMSLRIILGPSYHRTYAKTVEATV